MIIVKRKFKIFFREDGKLQSAIVSDYDLGGIWRNFLTEDKYANWAMVKDIVFNQFCWRDNIIDSDVLVRDLAMQQFVESEVYDKLTKQFEFKPLTKSL